MSPAVPRHARRSRAGAESQINIARKPAPSQSACLPAAPRASRAASTSSLLARQSRSRRYMLGTPLLLLSVRRGGRDRRAITWNAASCRSPRLALQP